MKYNIRDLSVASVSLLFICGMVEFLSTNENQNIEKRRRVRNMKDVKPVKHHTLERRNFDTPNRRSDLEVDLKPISELEGQCDVDISRQEEMLNDNTASNFVNIDIEYWFAIGATVDIDGFNDLSLFQLHQYVYTSVVESNIWCTTSTTSLSDINSTAPSRLGIITFIPTVLVPSNDLFCQTEAFLPDFSTTINLTKPLNCVVMRGVMQILSQPASAATVATFALQKELKSAITIASKETSMNNEIHILSYLGNTAEDAAFFLTDLSKKNDPPVGSIEEVSNESPSQNKSPVAFVFAVGIPLFLALIISMFLIRRRSIGKHGMNAIQSWEEYDPTANILKGTGDPPDSFHDGVYHYMNRGRQQYLSTRCTLCLETRRNIGSQMYAEALKCNTSMSSIAKILPKQYRTEGVDCNEDECDNDEAYRLARARSDMKLGQHHMGIDVHACQSATCVRCMANLEPMFVPTGIVRYPTNKHLQARQNSANEYDDDNSSLSSSQTPTSGNSAEDNQSYETKSTFNRDVCTPLPLPRSSPKKVRRWYSK